MKHGGKRTGAGRKTGSKAPKKSEKRYFYWLGIRVNKEEKTLLDNAAQASGLKKSEWARKVLLK